MQPAPQLKGIDLIQNPALLQKQIDLLYALLNLNIQLVVGQGAQKLAPGASSIVGTPPRLTLPIPLKLPAPIADADGTGSGASDQLNLLLAALRSTGQLPS